jgi:hypothetical protein
MYEVPPSAEKPSPRKYLRRPPDHKPLNWVWIALGAFLIYSGLSRNNILSITSDIILGIGLILSSLADLLPTTRQRVVVVLRALGLAGLAIWLALLVAQIVT